MSNVSVTVRVNGVNYKTYTCTVSVTSPSMSINGATTICTDTSNYSINSLPCNASVSWSVAPAGVVSLSCTSCSTTTLTKLADGVVTLTATITNVCGLGSIQLTKNITIGKPIISSNDALMIYSQPGDENEVCRYEGNTFNFTVTGDTSVTWNATSHQGGSWPSWNQAGDNLYVEFFTAAQQTLIMNLEASNICGSTTYDFGFIAIDCSAKMMSSKNQFKVSPNPANNVIRVTPAEVPAGVSKKPITQLIILDFNKNIVAQKKYNNEGSADLNIASLKPGVYYIQIISEKYSETQTILKK